MHHVEYSITSELRWSIVYYSISAVIYSLGFVSVNDIMQETLYVFLWACPVSWSAGKLYLLDCYLIAHRTWTLICSSLQGAQEVM
jgi:hypothetical protein